MLDDAAVFLAGAGKEPGDIDECHERDIEAVAEANEACRLDRGGDVQAAGQYHRLVGDDADGRALHAAEARDDVAGVVRLDLEEVAFVRDLLDQLLHVVGLGRIGRHQAVERRVVAVGRIAGRPRRRPLAVRGRQEIHEPAQLQQGLDVVLEGQVGNAGFRGVGHRPAQFLVGDGLVGHGLHHVRPGDEHVGGVLDHEDIVGHGRRVDRAAGARPHDQRDLRHHARGQHVALEDLGVAGQGGDAFLDAGAAGIVQADHRSADLDRLVHDLADLLGMGLGERAPEDREILAEHEDQPAVDGAVARHHAVAGDPVGGHPEVGAAVLDEQVPFLERALVEQDFQALARGQLTLAVLRVDAPFAAAGARAGAHVLEPANDVLHAAPPCERPAFGPARFSCRTARGVARLSA